MKIGSVQLKNDLVLAPLAGFSDAGFRSLAAKYGAGLTYTEMISAKGMCYNNEKTFDLLVTADNESPKAVQIFGSEPEFMYRAVKDERLDKFDIIDINMGCPVPKIVKNNEGSALLRNVPLAKELVQAVIEGANGRPVTVKFRKGFTFEEDLASEFAIAMEQAGASAITIHGRTREQYYGGRADWECIRNAKRAVSIPVIANGDVFTADDYVRIKEYTGCDGVMLARGAIGKPFLFSTFKGLKPEIRLCEDILYHIDVLLKFLPDRIVVNDMKKHICYYAKNVPDAKKIKASACRVETIEEMKKLVKEKFDFSLDTRLK